MPIVIHDNNVSIEIFDDDSFDPSVEGSVYDRIIQAEKDKPFTPNAQHALKVYQDGSLMTSAIILASGGATGIGKDAALIDQGNLVVRCCNKLFSLSLPHLEINWMAEPDIATCFSVHLYKDSYITHGELTVSRIDRQGKVLWSFGGADIFVCLYEGNPFEMFDEYIDLTDFNGTRYRIDYEGNLMDTRQPENADSVKYISLKSKKPWWKFW